MEVTFPEEKSCVRCGMEIPRGHLVQSCKNDFHYLVVIVEGKTVMLSVDNSNTPGSGFGEHFARERFIDLGPVNMTLTKR